MARNNQLDFTKEELKSIEDTIFNYFIRNNTKLSIGDKEIDKRIMSVILAFNLQRDLTYIHKLLNEVNDGLQKSKI